MFKYIDSPFTLFCSPFKITHLIFYQTQSSWLNVNNFKSKCARGIDNLGLNQRPALPKYNERKQLSTNYSVTIYLKSDEALEVQNCLIYLAWNIITNAIF